MPYAAAGGGEADQVSRLITTAAAAHRQSIPGFELMSLAARRRASRMLEGGKQHRETRLRRGRETQVPLSHRIIPQAFELAIRDQWQHHLLSSGTQAKIRSALPVCARLLPALAPHLHRCRAQLAPGSARGKRRQEPGANERAPGHGSSQHTGGKRAGRVL